MPPASLIQREDGLVLTDGSLSLRADFSSLLPRVKPGRLQQELLVKAAKVKGVDRPLAIDATAGLGEDAFLLAAAGFDVVLYERDDVIFALLQDALARAATNPELAAIAARMEAHHADSIAALGDLGFRPDVVVLDPMFPARSKSAAVKKKFQLIHNLEKPCEDEQALLEAARAAHPRKIVIKRPVKGPYLANEKPHYSLSGKAVRYDCFAFARAD